MIQRQRAVPMTCLYAPIRTVQKYRGSPPAIEITWPNHTRVSGGMAAQVAGVVAPGGRHVAASPAQVAMAFHPALRFIFDV